MIIILSINSFISKILVSLLHSIYAREIIEEFVATLPINKKTNIKLKEPYLTPKKR